MTALAMDVRELSFEEIDFVAGGNEAPRDSNGLTRDQNIAAASCITGVGLIGIAIVAGVSGPVGWVLFLGSLATTAASCRPQ